MSVSVRPVAIPNFGQSLAPARFGAAFPTHLKDHSDCVPTPPAVAQHMVGLLGISPGMRVLEPSAGTGNIAGEVRKIPGVNLDVVEYDPKLARALAAQDYHVVGNDFMAYRGQLYDRIIMNPPFSSKHSEPQSIAHVKHAYSMLKPGGRLAAIVPAWMFSGKGSQSKSFLDWLKNDTGHFATHSLDPGTFDNDESSTRVPTRIVVINKPAAARSGKKQSKRTRFAGHLDLIA